MRLLITITNGKGVRLSKAIDLYEVNKTIEDECFIGYDSDKELVHRVCNHYKVDPSVYFLESKTIVRALINDTHSGQCLE
jgi:hypothetical protein